MPDQALRIALIGAESTGKTALAQALVPRIQALTGLSCTWVPESLRIWCDVMGRTQVMLKESKVQLPVSRAYVHLFKQM